MTRETQTPAQFLTGDEGPSVPWAAVAIAGIVATCLIAYSNSFRGPFILDDLGSIPRNPTIRSLWPIWRPLSPPAGGFTVSGRPVLNLSLAINYALHGTTVGGYHAMNLVIHVLAALCVFGILRRTLRLPTLASRWGRQATALAGAVAAIWAAHPLQTNAVTYIIQRAEALVGLFYLLTLYLVLRGATGEQAWRWYAAAIGASALGMASKEVMVTAPLMVLLYDRVFLSGSWRELWRRRWGVYVGLAATWPLLGAMVWLTGARGTSAGFGQGMRPWQYALTQPGAIATYLRLCLWPDELVLDRGSVLAVGAWQNALLLGVIALLLAATGLALRYRPPFGFLGAWFFVVLAPTSSFVPVVTQTVAEHRMYIPSVAVVAFAVLGGYGLWRRLLGRLGPGGKRRRVLEAAVPSAVLAGAVVALSVATMRRNSDFRSALSIWQDTVSKWPWNPRAYYSLGRAMMDNHDFARAADAYSRTLELSPDHPGAYADRAVCRYAMREFERTVEDCTEALRLDAALARTYDLRGLAQQQLGRLAPAVRDHTRAIELDPNAPIAFENRAMAYYQLGHYAWAWNDLKRMRELGGRADTEFVARLRLASGRSE